HPNAHRISRSRGCPKTLAGTRGKCRCCCGVSSRQAPVHASLARARAAYAVGLTRPPLRQERAGEYVIAMAVATSIRATGTDEAVDLSGLTLAELERFVTEKLGERPFRARQIYRWIHQRAAVDFEEMTDLSKQLRHRLKERASIATLRKDLAL